MSFSDIEICNLALAYVGENQIRSFDDTNKRAYLCKSFYNHSTKYILSKFDWSFARKAKVLNELAEDSIEIPFGCFAHQLPSDCLRPLDILPYGHNIPWEINGRALFTYVKPITLRYTSREVVVENFTETFVNLVALDLATRLCMPMRSDRSLTRDLKTELATTMAMDMANDANIGNVYMDYDNHPDVDTFNTGEDTPRAGF